MIPLTPEDPLYVVGSPTNFMMLTRALTSNGESLNLTTPYVDQNQTYTSVPSHQVFLREYTLVGGRPYATGALLDGKDGAVSNGGLPTWAEVKAQAAALLGIQLTDYDIVSIPTVITDQYGKFTPAANGAAQLLSNANAAIPGSLVSPITTAGAKPTGHAFLDDIAHAAVPFGSGGAQKLPDVDAVVGLAGSSATYYDNELLDAHYITGDGRGNENIGLTSIHHIFHSEHNTVMADIKALAATLPGTSTARLNQWQQNIGGQTVWNGERLFQAARMVTEAEYQHLVFGEFARRFQPQLAPFAGYFTTVNADIPAEFAHAVYRFGHSMLNEQVARTDELGADQSMDLIPAFLNPKSWRQSGTYSGTTNNLTAYNTWTPFQGAGAVAKGMTSQRSNEIDEFTTEALRNNLVGLPLDLATLNMTRARETGTPSLNEFRRAIYNKTRNVALRPYRSWYEFGTKLRNPESLVNFVAAYSTHPTITGAANRAAKRAAAAALVDNTTATGYAFLHDTTTVNAGSAKDLENIDLWVGGLAERPALGLLAGILGTTFDYVFTNTLQNLQDGDRFYYLGRWAGTNFAGELEVAGFSQLVMRNSSAAHLPDPVFQLPNCTIEVGALTFNGVGLATNAPANCPNIIRTPTGRIVYDGMADKVVMGGTMGADDMNAGRQDDTVWGDGGNDDIEGGMGDDFLTGGTGNDVIVDEDGLDVLKGEAGDDVLNGGPGADIMNGGTGNDALFGGYANAKAMICSAGNDFAYGSDAGDAINGDDGNDWLEGAGGADVLTGNSGNAFQVTYPGDDVLIGGDGLDSYLGEGGTDIMTDNSTGNIYDGGTGYDWVTRRSSNITADIDLLNGNVIVPIPGITVDTFLFVEGISGGAGNDVLRGDDLGNGGFVNNDLTQPGLITGLSAVLRGATTYARGNIILGGAGSDLIQGRGGDDIIEGDKELTVRISVRSVANPNLEIASAASLADLTNDLHNRTISPSQLVMVREITTTGVIADTDTALYQNLRANYTIARVAGTTDTWTVTDNSAVGTNPNGLTANDGIDTVSGVELLQFADQIVTLPRPAVVGAVTFTPDIPIADTPITINSWVTPSAGATAQTYTWQYQNTLGAWINFATGNQTVIPTSSLVGRPLRVIYSYVDSFGLTNSFTSTPTQPVDPGSALPANNPATGAPVLSDTTPTATFAATAVTTSIADADGIASAFSYQWQIRTSAAGSAFADIAGATGASYTPVAGNAGQIIRVMVQFTDTIGYVETVYSAESGVVGNFYAGTANVDRYTGTAGSDVMNGLAGADVINGAAGADIIDGGANADTLTGGTGSDIFLTGLTFGADIVSDFDATPAGGQDFIDLRPLGITAANFATRVTWSLSAGTVLINVSNGTAQGTIRLNSVTNATLIDITDFITA